MILHNQVPTTDPAAAAPAFLRQGGRMTKWKGRAASLAPVLGGAAALALLSGTGAEAACTNTAAAARATAGSVCNGTNTTYSSAGGLAGVVQATGAGSTLTMTQGNVAVTSTNLHGLNAQTGGTIVFNGSVTAQSGQGAAANNARAVLVQNGNATLTVNGNLTATRRGGGTGGAAVEVAGTSAASILGNATITSNALSAQGVRVNSGGTLNIAGQTTILTTRSNSQGVIVTTTGSAGGGATAGSALARFANLTIQTLDTGSHAIQAIGALNNSVVVNGTLQITTAQTNSIGLYAQNGGKILVDAAATTGSADENALVTLLGGTIGTSGAGSHGVRAEVNAGTTGSAGITMGGGAGSPSVTTAGDDAEGLFANVSAGTGGATVRLNSGSVTTTGQNSDGLVAQVDDGNALTAINGDALAEMNGGSVSTSGAGSAGMVAQTDPAAGLSLGNATVRQTAGTISTSGGTLGGVQSSFGMGALAAGSGTATAEQLGGSILTQGQDGHGIYALSTAGDALVTQAAGGTVTANGLDASGIRAVSTSGGDVDVTLDGTVNGGTGAAAGLWMDTAAGQASRAAIGGSVGAVSGLAVADAAGDADVRVSAAGLVRGAARLGDGSDRLSFDGSDLSQTTTLDGGDDTLGTDGFVDVLTLGNLSATLTGANLVNWESVVIDDATVAFADDLLATGSGGGLGLSLVNGAILDARTTFALTGDLSVGAGSIVSAPGGGAGVYSVSGDVTNAGLIAFDDGAAGDVLTVAGNYTGSGGTLRFDTALGANASPTDLLHVMGNASGTTALVFQNVGGAGAATTQGIRVVQVDGTSTATAFSLGNAAPLQAGAYVYTLAFGDPANGADQSWYLRAATVPSGGGGGSGGGGSGSGSGSGGSGGGGSPVIGSIGALYELAPSVLMGGFADLPTLEERIGHGTGWSMGGTAQPGPGSRGWVRITDSRTTATPEVSASGGHYEAHTSSLQAGMDLAAFETAGGMWTFGATLQAGHVSADIANPIGRASLSGESHGIGATATWYGDSGTYVDLQARYDRIRADFAEATVGQLATDIALDQTTLSAEVGHRFALDGHRTLVPQAQLTWAHLSGDAFTDRQSSVVALGGNERLVGRLGLAYEVAFDGAGAGRGGRTFEKLYLIGNIEHDFSAETSVTVGGAALGAQSAATWGEVGLGGTVSWGENATLYGEGLYRQALDEAGGNDGLAVTAGLRITW